MNPQFKRFNVNGVKARAIYSYNETIRSALYQLKGCGDIELASIFVSQFSPILRLIYHGYSLIPAPSSQSHDDRRGFNQVIEIFKYLKLPIIRPIFNPFDIKQSDQSKKDRARIGEFLRYDESIKIQNKKILFVDDVYTTGSTCKACLKLIKEHNPAKIKVLVMSKVEQKVTA